MSSSIFCCPLNLDSALEIAGSLKNNILLLHNKINSAVNKVNKSIEDGILNIEGDVNDAINDLDNKLDDLLPKFDIDISEDLACVRDMISNCAPGKFLKMLGLAIIDNMGSASLNDKFLRNLIKIPGDILRSLSDQLFTEMRDTIFGLVGDLQEFVLADLFDKTEQLLRKIGNYMAKFESYIACLESMGCTNELSSLIDDYQKITLPLPSTPNTTPIIPGKKRILPELSVNLDDIITSTTNATPIQKTNLINAKGSFTNSMNKVRNKIDKVVHNNSSIIIIEKQIKELIITI